MPDIEINAPKLKVQQIPERPTHFYLTTSLATTAGPDGERIEISRPITNPFLILIRGQKNEAEINIEPLIQEALLHVLRGNDYSEPAPAAKKETTANFRIGVDLLGSGHAAVMYVDVTDDNGTYTDVQQTGIGRYVTRKEAAAEARAWSESEGVPLLEGFTDD